jgi:hypothetical protein
MLNMVGGDDATIPAATIDMQNFRPTALMTMGSSARGPDMSFNRIKPEIAAPGGNMVVSALEITLWQVGSDFCFTFFDMAHPPRSVFALSL